MDVEDSIPKLGATTSHPEIQVMVEFEYDSTSHQQDDTLLAVLELVPPVLLVQPKNRDMPCTRYMKTRVCRLVYT